MMSPNEVPTQQQQHNTTAQNHHDQGHGAILCHFMPYKIYIYLYTQQLHSLLVDVARAGRDIALKPSAGNANGGDTASSASALSHPAESIAAGKVSERPSLQRRPFWPRAGDSQCRAYSGPRRITHRSIVSKRQNWHAAFGGQIPGWNARAAWPWLSAPATAQGAEGLHYAHEDQQHQSIPDTFLADETSGPRQHHSLPPPPPVHHDESMPTNFHTHFSSSSSYDCWGDNECASGMAMAITSLLTPSRLHPGDDEQVGDGDDGKVGDGHLPPGGLECVRRIVLCEACYCIQAYIPGGSCRRCGEPLVV
ncbi:hypothetical protein DFH27DRAFT_652074 [Peziza echinospora]|nr:hypothetical protein DFH27DRAFT_652074 [Peziza echinospora]